MRRLNILKMLIFPNRVFMWHDKLILKFIWINKGPRKGKAILENKVEGLVLPDNKTYYKDIIIKILQYECRHRQTLEQKRDPGTDWDIYETRFMTVHFMNQSGKGGLFRNGTGKICSSAHKNKMKLDFYSKACIRNEIQVDEKAKIFFKYFRKKNF